MTMALKHRRPERKAKRSIRKEDEDQQKISALSIQSVKAFVTPYTVGVAAIGEQVVISN